MIAGSSPLARGLLVTEPWFLDPTGIIPARAGFTQPTTGRLRARRDHPRSRGVYIVVTAVDDAGDGSSPLARGLRDSSIGPSVPPRIIPARAGFTSETRRGTPSMRGSSPLARGLLERHMGCGQRIRIIPARAGFTGSGRGPRSQTQDHPRSRGVYSQSRAVARRPGGSSPLARGLRLGDDGHGHQPGIIPARAGFTTSIDPQAGRA